MKYFARIMLAIGVMIGAVSAAHAATLCPSVIPAPGSTVTGDLIVQSGQDCNLLGVTITGSVLIQTNAGLGMNPNGTQPSIIMGNVTVGKGAVFFPNGAGASNGATIGGNIVAYGCAYAFLSGTTVGGNVDIENCSQPQGKVIIPGYQGGVQIGGNFTCVNNKPACNAINGNVEGNVQVNDNAGAQVYGNTIGNNLICHSNGSITGGGNTVGGKKSGQCSGF
jgi:hypothetical protein